MFEAPCEAEASCAALCKAGLVYAAASEDMDTLCFACPKLARNLMSPASQGKPILEFDYEKDPHRARYDVGSSSSTCASCAGAITATASKASGR